jgi:hypothetical protein
LPRIRFGVGVGQVVDDDMHDPVSPVSEPAAMLGEPQRLRVAPEGGGRFDDHDVVDDVADLEQPAEQHVELVVEQERVDDLGAGHR